MPEVAVERVLKQEKPEMVCQVCNSALHLTAQETVEQLQAEIINSLKQVNELVCFFGFEVRSAIAKEDIQLSNYTGQSDDGLAKFTDHTLLHKALISEQMQSVKDGVDYVYFVPLVHSGAQNIWVLTFTKALSDACLKRLLHMANIYMNCAAHIGKGNTDPLTGLYNRQVLTDRLNRVLKGQGQRRIKDDKALELPSIAILDIDFFKRVNDDFGHLYGDEVLLLFSGLMKSVFRESDFLFRYGGEEFVVLLDTQSEIESQMALERFRKAIAAYEFPQVGRITVSCGFVQMQAGELHSNTIDKADRALYYAKGNGRNQVACYQTLLSQGLIEAEELQLSDASDSALF
ncbi:GGDEF domain-containing protein [Mariprofundus ferrooxydans]|nr:GGDEF domain-containing protein [Mariprofundus ferrooxydans]